MKLVRGDITYLNGIFMCSLGIENYKGIVFYNIETGNFIYGCDHNMEQREIYVTKKTPHFFKLMGLKDFNLTQIIEDKNYDRY